MKGNISLYYLYNFIGKVHFTSLTIKENIFEGNNQREIRFRNVHDGLVQSSLKVIFHLDKAFTFWAWPDRVLMSSGCRLTHSYK